MRIEACDVGKRRDDERKKESFIFLISKPISILNCFSYFAISLVACNLVKLEL